MMIHRLGRRLSCRSLLLAGGMALGLVLGSTGQTNAAYAICRTDPTIYLSDGATLTAYADTSDTLSDIQAVNYEVHVPSGVVATGITYDQYGYLETVTVIDDKPVGSYSIGTTVVTGTSHVPVTANASISGTCSYPPTSQNGASNLQLWIYFTC